MRREFIFDTKEGARKELGISGFVVVSAFGSQGAKVMNETIADMIPLEQADGFPFHHIHATGSFGKEWMPKRVMDNGVDWKNFDIIVVKQGYIHPELKAAGALCVMSLTDGATPQDTRLIPFKRIMRPMFPIDNI